MNIFHAGHCCDDIVNGEGFLIVFLPWLLGNCALTAVIMTNACILQPQDKDQMISKSQAFVLLECISALKFKPL